MTYKKLLTLNLFSVIGVVSLFSLTNPNSLGLVYATLALLLFYIFAATTITLVLKIAYDKQMSARRMLFISMVLGVILPLILAVSSLSTIRALDIVLIVAIPLIIVWYVQKRGLL